MSVGSERNKFFPPAFSRAAELQQVTWVWKNCWNAGASLDSLVTGIKLATCSRNFRSFWIAEHFQKNCYASTTFRNMANKEFLFPKIISSIQRCHLKNWVVHRLLRMCSITRIFFLKTNSEIWALGTSDCGESWHGFRAPSVLPSKWRWVLDPGLLMAVSRPLLISQQPALSPPSSLHPSLDWTCSTGKEEPPCQYAAFSGKRTAVGGQHIRFVSYFSCFY